MASEICPEPPLARGVRVSSSVQIILIAVFAATSCALCGLFLVLRRMAMMADAISHSVLPGLVAGYVLAKGPNLLLGFLGASAAGMATVVLVELLLKGRRVKEDAAIGLVFPAMFALGVFIISRYFANVHIDTDAVLYGDLVFAPFDVLEWNGRNLGPKSLWTCAALTLVNGAFLMLFWKELKLSTFDSQLAASSGFRPALLHYGLMLLVALTTVGAFSAVGAVLSVALIITPTAVALMLSRKLAEVLATAIAVGVGCAIAGYFGSTALDVSISGMIATVLGLAFLAALVFGPQRGLIANHLRRARQRLQFAADMLVVHLLNHEGTFEEPEESRYVHLETDLKWSPDRAQRTVEYALSKGLIESKESVLSLTEQGRKLAESVSAR
jgi:manganese/zinc/iron transport system permease protein